MQPSQQHSYSAPSPHCGPVSHCQEWLCWDAGGWKERCLLSSGVCDLEAAADTDASEDTDGGTVAEQSA